MTLPAPTERLHFRTWRPDDLELAVGLWGDPEVARFVYANGLVTRAMIEERLAREIATQDRSGIQYWPIFFRASGEHVGCCGLRPYRPEERIPELGVHIRPAFWRRGLAVEASRAVLDHAFNVLDAPAVFAGHNPANSASRELLARIGFVYTHDELYPPTGLMHPSYLYKRPG